MSAYELKTLTTSRDATIALIILAAVRLISLLTLQSESFTSADTSLSACYFTTIDLSLVTFIVAPLFVICMVPSAKTLGGAGYLTRLPARESVVFRFLAPAVIKAALFALVLNVSALIALLAKCPVAFPFADVACLFLASTLLEVVFLSICSLLVLLAFLLSGSVAIATLAALLYAIADFALSNIPLISNAPLTGWALTLIPALSFQSLIVRAIPLLAIFATILCLCLVVIGRRDLANSRGDESHD